MFKVFSCPLTYLTSFVIALCATSNHCLAQYAGNTVGSNQQAASSQLSHDISVRSIDPRFISVDGAAEIRVKPTEIRLVLAAVSEAKTAAECKRIAGELVARITKDWVAMGIAEDNIFEDFINILPVYEFEEQSWNSYTVMAEVLKRYRLQTNLHVKLDGNPQAKKALDVAFSHNVTDIISFDYWSPELEKVKADALKKAIKVAKQKAEIVFDPELFPERPKLVNFSESSGVVFPKQMYDTYVNTIEQSMTAPYNWRQNVPRVQAARPSTSYYHGPKLTGDALSPELPIKPEISVIAKVRLYYESPFEDEDSKE